MRQGPREPSLQLWALILAIGIMALWALFEPITPDPWTDGRGRKYYYLLDGRRIER